jgi:hypothetical protein
MTAALRPLCENSSSIFGGGCSGGGGGCLCISIHPGHTEQKPKEVVLSVECFYSAMWLIFADFFFLTNVLQLEVNLGSQFRTFNNNMSDVRT